MNGGSLAATAAATIPNNFNLNGTLRLVGIHEITFNGNLGGSTGSLSLRGPSATLKGAANFNGPVEILPFDAASPVLTVNDNGFFQAAGSFQIHGGRISLDNAAVNLNNRINDTAPINLFNATFSITGNATANTLETIGNTTADGGVRFAFAPTTSHGIAVNAGALTLVGHASVHFRATGPGVSLGSSAPLAPGGANIALANLSDVNNVNGILPFAGALVQVGTSTASTFVRYDDIAGIVPLNLATDYSTIHPHLVNDPTVNYRLTAPVRNIGGFVGSRSMNSLLLESIGDGSAKIGAALYGNASLTLTSGALFSSLAGGSSQPSVLPAAIAANLNFPGVTGHISASANLILFGNLTGGSGVAFSAGLAADGGGSIRLTGDNTELASGFTVNSGAVFFSRDDNLGVPTGNLNLGSQSNGRLVFLPSNQFESAAAANVTLNRSVNLLPGGGGIEDGLINSTVTLNGSIAGAGRFLISGPGTVLLAGTNSYTGDTVVTSGTVAVNSDSNLGNASSVVALAGGSLQLNPGFGSTARAIILSADSTIYANGSVNATFAGVIATRDSQTLALHGSGTLNFTAANSANGLLEIGDNNPARRGNSAFAQSGPTVNLSGNDGAFGTTLGVSIAGGATLHLDNSGGANRNRLGGGNVTLAGGTLKMTGSTTADTFEHIGTNTTLGLSNTLYGNTITLEQPNSGGGNRNTTLIATAYTTGPGVILFRGTDLGVATGDRTTILFATPPALVNGVLPGAFYADTATGEPQDFAATAAAAAGASSVVRFSTYSPLPPSGAVATVNYSLIGSLTLTASQSANGLKLVAGAIDLAGNTLTLDNAAMLLSVGNDTIANATAAGSPAVEFNANPARISVRSNLDLGTAASPVALNSTASLIKFGPGTLAISKTTIGGSYEITQGTLRLLAVAGLQTNRTVNILPGATLDLNSLGTAASPVGTVALSGFGTATLGSGALGLGAANTAFAGSFVGTGTLVLNGGNTQTLNGNSPDFTGSVLVLAGILRLDANVQPLNITAPGPLGSSTAAIQLGDSTGSNPARLALSNRVATFARHIIVPAGVPETIDFTLAGSSGSITTVSSNIVLNRRLTLNLGSTGIGSGSYTFTGNISGPGSLQIIGGACALWGNNSHGGGTFLDIDPNGNAPLGIGSDTAFGTGPVVYGANFNSGAALRANNGLRILPNAFQLRAAAVPFTFVGQNRFRLTGTIDLNNVLPGGGAINRIINIGTRNNANVEFAGVVLDSGDAATLVKTGTGTLILSGQNTYEGGTLLLEGVLAVGSSSTGSTSGPLGTGGFEIAGGTVRAVGGPQTINNAVTVSANFAVDGMNDIIMAGGTSVGNATRKIVVTNTGSTNFANVISGAGGGIEIDGTGTVTFSSPTGNNYSGGTAVLGGKLRVNNGAGTSGVGSGTLTVFSDAVLEGTGEIQADVVVSPGGTFSGGNSDSPAVGTLTQSAGSLTVPAGAKLRIGVLNGANPAAANTGGSTLTAGTDNNYFFKTGGTFSISSGALVEVDATSAVFNTLDVQYSYKVMQLNANATGILIPDSNITFIFAGNLSAAPGYNLVGQPDGSVYLNFIIVPEPAVAAGIVVILCFVRRRYSA